MERDETKELVKNLMELYPNYKPNDLTGTIDAWQYILEIFDYETIKASLALYIANDTTGFAPSIGQLISPLKVEKEYMTGEVAFGLVMRAVERSGYHAVEEFEKLPSLVQKALGSPSVLRDMALDEHFNLGVSKSQFIKSYNTTVERAKHYDGLTPQLKQLHDQVNRDSDVTMLEAKTKLLIEQTAQRIALDKPKEEFIDVSESKGYEKYAEKKAKLLERM